MHGATMDLNGNPDSATRSRTSNRYTGVERIYEKFFKYKQSKDVAATSFEYRSGFENFGPSPSLRFVACFGL